ncbi:MAG: phosphoglycerate mutase family protein [Candidatus Thiodiazotropha sp.]
MKIILMRHGEPKINLSDMVKERYSAIEIEPLIKAYNESGLNAQNKPTSKALRVTKTCKAVVCSDLPRSIESAKALRVSKICLIDSVFRESDLPYAEWRYPRLELFTWFLFFRAIWFLGYSNNGEPISSARKRSKIAFLKLKQIVDEHGSVMLIGHGIINRLVAKELRKNGWCGPKNPGNNYWEYGIYEYRKI